MKKISFNLRVVSLVLITGIFIASCDKDETASTPSIKGTWTAGTASVKAMPGSQILIGYMAQYYMEKDQIHQILNLYNEKTGLDDVILIEADVNFTKQ